MQNLLSSITNIRTWFKQHQTFLIPLALFLLVFTLLGIPFSNWWFYGADDSHALFLAYKTKTWKQLFYFFYDGHVNQGQTGPSNYFASAGRTGFLSTYYRPLCLVLYTFFYWIFGVNGYAFHLINVGAHALNTSLIFLILRWFTSSRWACLTCLLFAFHPQIAFRFGAFVNMQYYLSLTGILAIIMLFKRYLDPAYAKASAGKHPFYLLACLIYAPVLFLRESAIVLPVIMFVGTYFYKNNKFKNALKNTMPFFILMISFLLLRLWLYPLTFVGKQTISVQAFLKNFIATKIPEVQVFLYDLFNLSWLPWGQPLLRASIMLLLLSAMLWLFIHNTKKLYVCSAAFIAACMLWPAGLGPYSPRYFYEVHPFVLITFVLLFTWQKRPWSHWQKKMGLITLSSIVMAHIIFCVINFKRRAEKMGTLHNAIEHVIQRDTVKLTNRPLCFVGHPFDGFACQNAQIFWVLLDNPSRKIYFDSATSLISPHANVIISTHWFTITSNYPTEDHYAITPIQNGFMLTSHDPDEIHFCTLNHGFSLGEKIVHRQEQTKTGHSVITQLSLVLEQKYLNENPIFLSWSFKHQAFVAIEAAL